VIIPKEELSSFQRWQAGSFDKKQPAAKTATPTPPPAPAATPAHAPASATAAEPPTSQEPAIHLPTAEEIERIHEEARASGYAAGLAEGQAKGEKLAHEAAVANGQRFKALIDNLQQALDTVDQSVADQLLGLALEVAAQVARGVIAAKNDALLPIIREAIATLPLHHSHVILRMHPEDAANVRALLGEEFAQTGTQIVEDGGIAVGGCLLQAGASEVDATIETRWKRVIESIGCEPREWLSP